MDTLPLAFSILANPGTWILVVCALALIGCIAWAIAQRADDSDRRGRW